MGINFILTRRSVRKFTSQEVDEDQLVALLKAAMSAPSAGNQQPWHFIVVKDFETRKKLAAAHPYAKMVIDAPVAVVVCGDPSLEKFSGYWMQDCSAATQNLLLAAHSMGLGAVWTGVFPEGERIKTIQEILKIPEGIFPFSMIPIGYAAEEAIVESRLMPERVHEESW